MHTDFLAGSRSRATKGTGAGAGIN